MVSSNTLQSIDGREPSSRAHLATDPRFHRFADVPPVRILLSTNTLENHSGVNRNVPIRDAL
jgi:hypothetical protein